MKKLMTTLLIFVLTTNVTFAQTEKEIKDNLNRISNNLEILIPSVIKEEHVDENIRKEINQIEGDLIYYIRNINNLINEIDKKIKAPENIDRIQELLNQRKSYQDLLLASNNFLISLINIKVFLDVNSSVSKITEIYKGLITGRSYL